MESCAGGSPEDHDGELGDFREGKGGPAQLLLLLLPPSFPLSLCLPALLVC